MDDPELALNDVQVRLIEDLSAPDQDDGSIYRRTRPSDTSIDQLMR